MTIVDSRESGRFDSYAGRADQITARAREVRPGHALLVTLFFLFSLIGKTAGFMWLALVWIAFAIGDGWREVVPRRVQPNGPP